MQTILVTGAGGQIGVSLVQALKQSFPDSKIIPTDVTESKDPTLPVRYLDVRSQEAVQAMLMEHQVDIVFHLAAILSATGEKNPALAWEVNMNGLVTLMNACRDHHVKRLIVPSSIGAFGPSTPKTDTPDETIMRPTSMYGITKVSGELLIEYYYQRYGLDGRSMRFPGIVSSESEPGGGTTDYADDFYRKAVAGHQPTCFLKPDTRLPFMYMPDAVRVLIELAKAPDEQLSRRVYNVAAMNVTPAELTAAIREHLPEFDPLYEPDDRQAIADSWPHSLDDSAARHDWGWTPEYDLARMTEEMLERLKNSEKRSE